MDEGQLEFERLQEEINNRELWLKDSDYKALKFLEGSISAEDYEPIKAQRQAWRDEINEYQEQQAALNQDN